MKYNLFLDDIRNPSDVQYYIPDDDYIDLHWLTVRNHYQFMDTIIRYYELCNVLPYRISFDHDLADTHYSQENQGGELDYTSFKEKTGYHCALWLIDFCTDHNLTLPKYKCHSMNPVGKKNILSLLDNFKITQK